MKPLLATLAGLATSALVVVAAAVVSSPDARAKGAQAAASTMPRGPVANAVDGEVPLGDSVEMWGRPGKLSMFWTTDDTETIVDFYADSWRNAGLVPQVKTVDRVTSVTAIEAKSGLMRSVTILSGGGEERVVMPGVIDVRGTPDVSSRNAPFPLPDEAKVFLGQSIDDVTSIAFNGTFVVPWAPAAVVAYYEKNLTAKGYTRNQDGVGRAMKPGTAGGEWTRGGENIAVAITTLEETKDVAPTGISKGKTGSQVFVTHVRAIAVDGDAAP